MFIVWSFINAMLFFLWIQKTYRPFHAVHTIANSIQIAMIGFTSALSKGKIAEQILDSFPREIRILQ